MVDYLHFNESALDLVCGSDARREGVEPVDHFLVLGAGRGHQFAREERASYIRRIFNGPSINTMNDGLVVIARF